MDSSINVPQRPWRVIDLLGKVFGDLQVISFSGMASDGEATWECRCVCSKTVTFKGYDLRRGAKTNCGCKKVPYFKDLTGLRFGKLTVLSQGERSHDNKLRWSCKCDCGNTILCGAWKLHSKHPPSCGCIKYPYDDADRTALKLRNKGRKTSEETKQHLSEILTGRVFTTEWKEKISETKRKNRGTRGKKLTKVHKYKISISLIAHHKAQTESPPKDKDDTVVG